MSDHADSFNIKGIVSAHFAVSTTEKSACNSCPNDDVMSKTFQYLDGPDLLSCTKVCMKWRCIMESLVIGRRFFQRMTKPSDAWRRAWRDLGQDETNLKQKKRLQEHLLVLFAVS